ncbi:MAG: hypothetical protein ABIQ09_07550 [Jatrophihabitantaceae bacterium]
MASIHPGTHPDGPDEGLYDARVGATVYSPIVGAFGALAVTAIAVVFTASDNAPSALVAFATGLLAAGVFGSLVGSFGLAAIGAERHPTANIAPAIMFVAVPVALSIIAILGAFEVLAKIYVPESTRLFVLVTGAGGIYAVILTATVIGDATGLHPSTLTASEFDVWRGRQWLQNRAMSYTAANKVIAVTIVPPILGMMLRLFDIKFSITHTGVTWIVGTAIALSLLGAVMGADRTKHPLLGNDQVSMRKWEAWVTTAAISLWTLGLLLFLP